MDMVIARYEAEAADPERLRAQRDGLWDLARVNAAEIARLQQEVRELRDNLNEEHRLREEWHAEARRLRYIPLDDILDRIALPRKPSSEQIAWLRSFACQHALIIWPESGMSGAYIRSLITEWERIRTNGVPEACDGQDGD